MKRLIQGFIVIALLVSSFAFTDSASAWYNCASYITVQWGDTLSGLAAYCGTTVSAIRAANQAKEEGVARTILFNLCGHGHFDMAAYEAYFGGKLQRHEACGLILLDRRNLLADIVEHLPACKRRSLAGGCAGWTNPPPACAASSSA